MNTSVTKIATRAVKPKAMPAMPNISMYLLPRDGLFRVVLTGRQERSSIIISAGMEVKLPGAGADWMLLLMIRFFLILT